IQFIRYASVLKERGAKVILECPPKLAPLMRYAADVDQVIERIPTASDEAPHWKSLPPIDMQARLMSLPALFNTTPQNIPAKIPYLAPPTQSAIDWKEKLAAFA